MRKAKDYSNEIVMASYNKEEKGDKYRITIEVSTNEIGGNRVLELRSMLYHTLHSLLWDALGSKVKSYNYNVEKI